MIKSKTHSHIKHKVEEVILNRMQSYNGGLNLKDRDLAELIAEDTTKEIFYPWQMITGNNTNLTLDAMYGLPPLRDNDIPFIADDTESLADQVQLRHPGCLLFLAGLVIGLFTTQLLYLL